MPPGVAGLPASQSLRRTLPLSLTPRTFSVALLPVCVACQAMRGADGTPRSVAVNGALFVE